MTANFRKANNVTKLDIHSINKVYLKMNWVKINKAQSIPNFKNVSFQKSFANGSKSLTVAQNVMVLLQYAEIFQVLKQSPTIF